MNLVGLKKCAAIVVVVGVAVGCGTAIQQATTNNNNTSSGSSEFNSVESTFSTASLSPGGAGSTVGKGDDKIEATGQETRSFFTAFQIDPESEDTAGPKFVKAADVDQDGFLDLVTAWNQSQPVQLHLQRRDSEGNISFRTINLGGTTPLAIIAGVEFGQINGDGWLDIVVLSKASGFVTLCNAPPGVISALEGEIVVLFSPGNPNLIADGDSWREMILVNPLIQDPWIHNQFPGNEPEEINILQVKPEMGGFTSLAVGEIDGQPGDEIVVALNPGECEGIGQKPPVTTVDLWINPGPAQAETFTAWGAPLDTDPATLVPISLIIDAPEIRDVELMDIDNDGDLDVLACVSNALSLNVRWVRNPLVAHTPGGPDGFNEVIQGASDGWRFITTSWQERPIGQIDTGADVMALGDIDGDGDDDVVVRSANGQVVQWFRRPNALTVAPEFPPNDPVPTRFNFPWPVFTLTEFNGQEPEAIALGDLTGDGKLNLVAAAEGAVFWYDGTVSGTVFDPWKPNTIIQDSPVEPMDTIMTTTSSAPPTDPNAGGAAPGAGVGVEEVDTSTHINALLVVDLDADGRNDIVGTLDRRSGAGLSDDRLVWYRNTRTEDEADKRSRR